MLLLTVVDNYVDNGLEIEKNMFRAVRELGRKSYENPFVTNPSQIHKIVKDHFESHFYKEGEHEVETFIGECKQRSYDMFEKIE